MSDVTQILNAFGAGDPQAADQLLPLVYEELRKLAAQKLNHEPSGQTLQPTALVHEAYLRLVGKDGDQHWDGRRHFFAAAAEAMRRILIDNARGKKALKRSGNLVRNELDAEHMPGPAPHEDLEAVNEALQKLATTDPQEAKLVELRFFAGFTMKEAAEILEISEKTAPNRWAHARAWLYQELNGGT